MKNKWYKTKLGLNLIYYCYFMIGSYLIGFEFIVIVFMAMVMTEFIKSNEGN